jgi:3-methylfumaryl-CoA hydratase
MWAGGRLRWEQDLVIGDAIERVSTIKSVTHKSGRSGDLLFVLVEHQIHNAKGLALTEEHDIVYRAAASPDEKAPDPTLAPSNAKWSKIIQPDPVLLFRYSALTFNGHRIHYDRSYVTQEEGYPGLIVHGPLIATLLVDLVRQSNLGKKLKRFEFRAVRPTFDIHSMQVNASPDLATDSSGKTLSVWAQDHEGWLTMQAKAELV